MLSGKMIEPGFQIVGIAAAVQVGKVMVVMAVIVRGLFHPAFCAGQSLLLNRYRFLKGECFDSSASFMMILREGSIDRVAKYRDKFHVAIQRLDSLGGQWMNHVIG